MSYNNNPYRNADNFGLKLVAEMELSEPMYSFDTLAAWRDEAGNYYIATDSGCSCPSPFENYDGIKDLTGPLTYEQVITEAASLVGNSYSKDYALGEFPQFVANLQA